MLSLFTVTILLSDNYIDNEEDRNRNLLLKEILPLSPFTYHESENVSLSVLQ